MRVRCVGTFCIRRGRNPAARLVARMLRLPADADDVPTTLRILTGSHADTWERVFGDSVLATTHRTLHDGTMVERFHFVELRYRAMRNADGVEHRQTSAALACGGLRVPLPRWLAPSVVGFESATATPNLVRVQVEVRLPVIGMLLSYDGVVKMLETWP
jgi:hypothetical protein